MVTDILIIVFLCVLIIIVREMLRRNCLGKRMVYRRGNKKDNKTEEKMKESMAGRH